MAQCLRSLKRSDEACDAGREGIRRAEHTFALNPYDARALSVGSLALFEDGQRARAFEWLQSCVELQPDDVCVLVNAACLRAKAGQNDEALTLLERVFARGMGKRDWVEHDTDFDNLRDDPRFHRLLARLK